MSAPRFAPVLVRVRAWRAGDAEPHAGFARAYRAPRPLALQAAMRHARAAFRPEDRERIEADIVEPPPAPACICTPIRCEMECPRCGGPRGNFPGCQYETTGAERAEEG